MKTIKLSEICKVLKIKNKDSLDVDFVHITNDITKINDHTLVFHLNKDIELNMKHFEKLTNCFIITDQPLLQHTEHEKQYIFVLDIHSAYEDFINYYRNLFKIPVVAITGTCGKTTTKEIVKQVLESKYVVASTISNKNNLGFNHGYLMSIDDQTNYGVFETAISYPGDLIKGCKTYKPTIGVITNIGIDHLSGCKTIENYIRTKGEMLAGLQYKGTLIINQDDENIKKINFNPYKGKILNFGLDEQADFYATHIQYKENGMEFILHYKKREYPVFVPGLGTHNVYNALAALAVLTVLGEDMEYCTQQLAKVKFIRSHIEVHQGFNDSTLIDDTWSSNPTSMRAALEVLREKGKDKVKIVILGKISYLGDYALAQYEQIGKMVVEHGIDFLVTTDSFSKSIGDFAEAHGMNSDFIIHCKNNDDLMTNLECLLDKNSIALFKTSMFDKSISEVIKQLIKDK